MKKFIVLSKRKRIDFTVEFDEMLNFDCNCQIFSNDVLNVPHE